MTKEQAAEEWYTTTIKEGRLQKEKDGHSGSWDEYWMPTSMGPVEAFTAGYLKALSDVKEWAEKDVAVDDTIFLTDLNQFLEERGK